MNNLILKMHPKQLAYFIDRDNYGIIPVDTNLIISGEGLLYVHLRTDDLRNAVAMLE